MKPLIIAHRGAMAEAPENTITAFKKALKYRVHGIELDVQITKDHQPVIFHDQSLQQIIGSPKCISDFTLEELYLYDWGSWFGEAFKNEKIPTLDQVLTDYGSKTRLMIEIKPAPKKELKNLYFDLAAMVTQQIRNLVPRDRVPDMYILSFEPELIKSAFVSDPHLNYVLNLSAPRLDQRRLNIDPELLCGYCIEHTLLDRHFVEKSHRENKLVISYSCNSFETLKRLLELDIDVVMTDDPGNNIWSEFSF